MAKKRSLSLHDKFFKASLQDKRIAQDFFKAHLPAYLKKMIDWSSLSLQPGSFIDSCYASAYSDILYQADFLGEPGYLYVLTEHQSKPDRLMPLRLWLYLCRIWDLHLKQNEGATADEEVSLPLIYRNALSWKAFTLSLFNGYLIC